MSIITMYQVHLLILRIYTHEKVDSAESNYSAGDTFFQYCDEPPRIRLEAYAKSIFDHHTRHMKFDRR